MSTATELVVDDGDGAMAQSVLHPMYLDLSDYHAPYDVWAGALQAYLRAEQSVMWYIGDLYLRGEDLFGEAAAQAIPPTAYAAETVRGAVWVCGRYAPHERIEGLYWSHHKAAAALPPDARREVLWMAREHNLSYSETIDLVRQRKAAAAPPQTPALPQNASSASVPALSPKTSHTDDPGGESGAQSAPTATQPAPSPAFCAEQPESAAGDDIGLEQTADQAIDDVLTVLDAADVFSARMDAVHGTDWRDHLPDPDDPFSILSSMSGAWECADYPIGCRVRFQSPTSGSWYEGEVAGYYKGLPLVMVDANSHTGKCWIAREPSECLRRL